MVVRTIAQLKTDMPIGVPGGTTVSDMHNLLDTLESLTSQAAVQGVALKTVNYTATSADNGICFVFDVGAPVTLTLPSSLPAGWRCSVLQAGAGQVVVVATGGALKTLNSTGHNATSGQFGVIDLVVYANAGSSPQVSLRGATAAVAEIPRLALSTIPEVLAAWDPSLASARTPSGSTSITALADRYVTNNALTAAAAGTDVGAVVTTPGYLTFTGGNSQRRFDAKVDVADNMFAGGGMLSVVFRSASAAGVLMAKWATAGWILYAPTANTLRLEYYVGDGSVMGKHTWTIPNSASAWSLMELEWNATSAQLPPVVRMNGIEIGVAPDVPGVTTLDDSAATLVVGNRNWGTFATPWTGDVGEIVLTGSIPTTQQKTDLRTDLMNHWGIAPPAALQSIDISQWTLTFDEDFLGTSLNRRLPNDVATSGNRWSTSMGEGTVRYLNDERQIYVEPEYKGTNTTALNINPFSVANSVLTITCQTVSTANQPYLPKSYTSGLITTQQTYSQLYGYFEMRAQMPGGMGTWPAFWLLFHGTPGAEFDIVEGYGVNTTSVFQTVHQPTGSTGYETLLDWTNGWHTYGMKWTEQEIVYYLDRQPTARHPNTTNTPGYIIANLALEGRSDRAPDSSTIFPLQMKIDYIRCYQPA